MLRTGRLLHLASHLASRRRTEASLPRALALSPDRTASNGETVATSASYSNAAGARRGAEPCKRAAAAAEIVDDVASSDKDAEKLAKQ